MHQTGILRKEHVYRTDGFIHSSPDSIEHELNNVIKRINSDHSTLAIVMTCLDFHMIRPFSHGNNQVMWKLLQYMKPVSDDPSHRLKFLSLIEKCESGRNATPEMVCLLETWI